MFVLVLVMLVLFPSLSAEGAKVGFDMAVKTVLPSLLPFAVFSSAVIYSGFGRVLGALLSPVFSLFNISPMGCVSFVTSLLGGYPSGVRCVCDLLEEGLVTKKEAERLLAFSNNAGVVFMISVCGMTAFGSASVGIMLWIVHIVSALIVAIIFNSQAKYEKVSVRDELKKYKKNKPPAMLVLGKSISSAGSAMVNVWASMVVFNSLLYVLHLSEFPLLAGVVEMTKGVFLSSEAGNLPLSAMLVSFGGLSVHAQAASIVQKYELDLKRHTLGKIISGGISFLIMYALVNISWDFNMILFFLLAMTVLAMAVRLVKRLIANVDKECAKFYN